MYQTLKIKGIDDITGIFDTIGKVSGINSVTVDSKAVTVITYVIAILLLISAITGFKRGILADGRRLISIIAGFLAVPIVSPHIEKLLLSMLGPSFTFDHPVMNIFGAYSLRFLVFSLSLVLVRFIVSSLISLDNLPKPIQIIDKILGGLCGALKICILIWLIDIIVSKVSMFPTISATLDASDLYREIAGHNMIRNIFSI